MDVLMLDMGFFTSARHVIIRIACRMAGYRNALMQIEMGSATIMRGSDRTGS
jgi:hypothetical protein